MKPILYNYFRSSASYRVRIALHLKKIDFEYRAINLREGEHRHDEFLKMNPKGEVPCFVENDLVLNQSLVICEYLDSKYPIPLLFPKEQMLRLKCLEIWELISSGIQPIQNLSVIQELTKRFGASEETKADWCRFWIDRGLSALEKILIRTSGKYCIGNEVTAADLCLVPQVFSALRYEMDLTKYPRVLKINEECLKLDAFVKAQPANQPDFVK